MRHMFIKKVRNLPVEVNKQDVGGVRKSNESLHRVLLYDQFIEYTNS